jgi:hypothetical protein
MSRLPRFRFWVATPTGTLITALREAALVGLDRGETVAISSLPNIADGHEAARQNLFPTLSLGSPVVRDRVTTA